MKRIWIGVGLLTLALVAGILAAEWMDETHEEIGEDIEKAAVLAMAEEWAKVDALADRARRNWEKTRPVIAMLADHEPLESIDGLFRQLEVYAAAGESSAFCAVCASMAQLLEALGDCHKCSVRNLL